MGADVPLPEPTDDDLDDASADEAAALDDYLGGFSAGVDSAPTPSGAPEQIASTLDLILRLRQAGQAGGHPRPHIEPGTLTWALAVKQLNLILTGGAPAATCAGNCCCAGSMPPSLKLLQPRVGGGACLRRLWWVRRVPQPRPPA